jgi:hypothetical protein
VQPFLRREGRRGGFTVPEANNTVKSGGWCLGLKMTKENWVAELNAWLD